MNPEDLDEKSLAHVRFMYRALVLGYNILAAVAKPEDKEYFRMMRNESEESLVAVGGLSFVGKDSPTLDWHLNPPEWLTLEKDENVK